MATDAYKAEYIHCCIIPYVRTRIDGSSYPQELGYVINDGLNHQQKRVTDVILVCMHYYNKSPDIFFPLTGGCSEGLDAFSFFFKQPCDHGGWVLTGFDIS